MDWSSLGEVCRYLGKAPPTQVARARGHLVCHNNIMEDSMDKCQCAKDSDGCKATGTRGENMEDPWRPS